MYDKHPETPGDRLIYDTAIYQSTVPAGNRDRHSVVLSGMEGRVGREGWVIKNRKGKKRYGILVYRIYLSIDRGIVWDRIS